MRGASRGGSVSARAHVEEFAVRSPRRLALLSGLALLVADVLAATTADLGPEPALAYEPPVLEEGVQPQEDFSPYVGRAYPDRVLFGVDFPLGDVEKGDRNYRQTINAIEQMDISDEERSKIYADNARKLMRLPI